VADFHTLPPVSSEVSLTAAVRAGDGSVSYSLEYAGLKFVFDGDTEPDKWFPELAKGGGLDATPPRCARKFRFGHGPPGAAPEVDESPRF
jgi:hypothetical protein